MTSTGQKCKRTSRSFVQSPIHRLLTTGGDRMPRTVGPTFSRTEHNGLFWLDDIKVRQRCTRHRYVFMICDDHSHYGCVYPALGIYVEKAPMVLPDGYAAFGISDSECRMGWIILKMKHLDYSQQDSRFLSILRYLTIPGVKKHWNVCGKLATSCKSTTLRARITFKVLT